MHHGYRSPAAAENAARPRDTRGWDTETKKTWTFFTTTLRSQCSGWTIGRRRVATNQGQVPPPKMATLRNLLYEEQVTERATFPAESMIPRSNIQSLWLELKAFFKDNPGWQ